MGVFRGNASPLGAHSGFHMKDIFVLKKKFIKFEKNVLKLKTIPTFLCALGCFISAKVLMGFNACEKIGPLEFKSIKKNFFLFFS